jgi:hypothetical protein
MVIVLLFEIYRSVHIGLQKCDCMLNCCSLCLFWIPFYIILPVFGNPCTHCFKAITKLTASGWKEPFPPHPMYCTVGGGAFSAALKICLIKAWLTFILLTKAHWKWRCNGKSPDTKKLQRYIARFFFVFNKSKPIQDLFPFWKRIL